MLDISSKKPNRFCSVIEDMGDKNILLFLSVSVIIKDLGKSSDMLSIKPSSSAIVKNSFVSFDIVVDSISNMAITFFIGITISPPICKNINSPPYGFCKFAAAANTETGNNLPLRKRASKVLKSLKPVVLKTPPIVYFIVFVFIVQIFNLSYSLRTQPDTT
jgi:hypothetical protein